ncbi:MAG TPA: hypothetical protein VFG83_08605 [Kofleriaceae bacterium]|nr:hypothetical protein [Kofleriaceae bacterium]
MSTRIIMVLSLLSLALAGCGGDDGSELEGIYTLASWTTNPDSCTEEGGPDIEADGYTHFFVRKDSFFGQSFIAAVMCADLEECRTKAADKDTLYIGQFTFDENGDGGWTGTSTFLFGEDCAGTVSTFVLTGDPGVSVRIDSKGRAVTNVPKDSDGFCDTDAAEAQAEGQPCDQLTVVTGDFLEGI